MTLSFDKFNALDGKYSKFRGFLSYFYSIQGKPYNELGVIYKFVSISDASYLEKTINSGKELLKLKELPCQLITNTTSRYPTNRESKSTMQEYRDWIQSLISVLEEGLKIKTGRIKITKEERDRRKSLIKTYINLEKLKESYASLCSLLGYFSLNLFQHPLVEEKYTSIIKRYLDLVDTEIAYIALNQGQKILNLKRFPADAISYEVSRSFPTPEACKAWVRELLDLLRDELSKRKIPRED